MKKVSISHIFNKFIALIILVLLLTQAMLMTFIVFISRDYKHGIVNAAADKIYTILENEFIQIESISDNMIKNGCLVEYISDNTSKSIYYYLDVVKNKKEQFIYAVFVDSDGKDVRISNDISNNDYALLTERIKQGQFTEKRGIAIIDTPYKEALLISQREIEVFDFKELKMKQLGNVYLCSKVNLNKIVSELGGDVKITNAEIVADENIPSEKTEKGCILINKPILNYFLHVSGRPLAKGFNNNYYKVCIYVMLGEMFLLLAIIVLLYRNVKKKIQEPILSLTEYLDDCKTYNDKTVMDISGASEIVHICTHIQRFIDKLTEQTRLIFTNQQRMYEMEILNREYQYEALQSQINPHFLYNAINCIHGMAGYYKISSISRICEGMSAILRYSLDTEKYVTLSDELDIIKQYIEIMRLRLNADFEVKTDIAPELSNMQIIKMSLQPAVENAFVHGEFYKNKKRGSLEIKAEDESGMLVVSITDNGKGISPDRLLTLKREMNEKSASGKSHGLGLRNVNLRIKSEYGEEYGITVESIQNERTVVKCSFKKTMK